MRRSSVRLALIYLVGLFFALTLGYFGWHLERCINYRYGYEQAVQQQIRQLVKPECLKEKK